jgi:hypothetical protein
MISAAMEGLENGEFLVLTDESFHAVGQSGLQIQLSPVILHVTNRRIIVEPQFDIEMTRNIVLSSITGFGHMIVNDIPVLAVLSDGPSPALRLFIPDDTRKRVFQELAAYMHAVAAEPADVADKAALALRHLIHESPTIQHFYDTYRGPPVVEPAAEEVEAEDPKARERLTVARVRALLAPYDFLANLIVISPALMASILGVLAAALTLVFRVVSFGAFAAAGGLTVVIVFGIQKLLGVDHTIEEVPVTKVQEPMQPFFRASNRFCEQVNDRIFWADRAAALQLGAFCLTLLLLFVLFDPTFLLVVSLLGLAFFERWSAFGMGSLSAILSHLILW